MFGILGGSGLYDLNGIENLEERTLSTAFGDPSDAYMCGRLAGHDVCFLPRHGRGHRLLPAEINHRANIMGFKLLGVTRVVSVSAVGSLKEAYRPRDIVLPNQYLDRSKQSAAHTFFGQGIVAHISFAEPVCPSLSAAIREAAEQVAAVHSPETRVHSGGTYVHMEGPAFSTRAESEFHRHFGYDVIGMTSLAEAKLCREAEICYQSMAMVTDYDCWHETEEIVSVESVIGHLMANSDLARHVLEALIPGLPESCEHGCGEALKYAIITSPEVIPEERYHALRPLVGKYLDPD